MEAKYMRVHGVELNAIYILHMYEHVLLLTTFHYTHHAWKTNKWMWLDNAFVYNNFKSIQSFFKWMANAFVLENIPYKQEKYWFKIIFLRQAKVAMEK